MDPIIFLLIIGFAWISLNTIARIQWFDAKNPEIGLDYAFYRTTRLNQLIYHSNNTRNHLLLDRSDRFDQNIS